jgi:hypothetical protein
MARIKDAAAQEWMKAERLVRKHSLPLPARKRAEIAKDLEAEMKRPDRAGNAVLRALAMLLWSAGNAADAPLVARAKFLDFDAGSMIDADFLMCGEADAVLSALDSDPDAASAKAASIIRDSGGSFSRAEKLAAEQAFYGIETGLDEG